MTDKIGIFRILIRHAIKKPPGCGAQNKSRPRMKQERQSQQNRQVLPGAGVAACGTGAAKLSNKQPRHHALQRHRRHKLVAFALNVELISEQNEVVLRDRKTQAGAVIPA